MQISASQTSETSLAAFGAEAVQLLCAGELARLVDCFGYALAFGREPVIAVQDDLAVCLAEVNAKGMAHAATGLPVKVKYLEPNDSGLFAVVEGLAPTDNGAAVLLELVVSAIGDSRHVMLEQLSVAA